MQKTKHVPAAVVNRKVLGSPYEIADLALRIQSASQEEMRSMDAVDEALGLLRTAQVMSDMEAEMFEHAANVDPMGNRPGFKAYGDRLTMRVDDTWYARIDSIRDFKGSELIQCPTYPEFPLAMKDAVKCISGDAHLPRRKEALKKALLAEARARTGKGLNNKDAAALLNEKWNSTLADAESFWSLARMLAPHCGRFRSPRKRTSNQHGA